MIDQICFGDNALTKITDLSRVYVDADRIVNIVSCAFKSSQAKDLIRDSKSLDVP